MGLQVPTDLKQQNGDGMVILPPNDLRSSGEGQPLSLPLGVWAAPMVCGCDKEDEGGSARGGPNRAG